MPDVGKRGLFHPSPDFPETVAAPARRGEKHKQTEDRAHRRMVAAIVENMVFNKEAASRIQAGCELADERLVVAAIFTVDDVR